MKNVDYYPLGPRTRAWHWSRCSALCPGCVDTAQAARRVTEARALNHSYQMLWYSDIGPRHSAITLSPSSANQRLGWLRSDQSESSICSACDQIVVPGSYSLYPGRVKYQSSALTLCSISCPALHCSLLAYNTNRKCAQVIWRTHGAIWKNVRWVGSEHEVIMIMTVFPPYLNIKWWDCKLLPILLINKTARPWLEL